MSVDPADQPAFDPDRVDAVLFDLDGVITPTAEVHVRAWRSMFTDFLASEHPDVKPYSDADYFNHIDGKPRLEGVEAFLVSRDIEVTDGVLKRLGEAKNAAFTETLEAEGVDAYPGSVDFLEWVESLEIEVAVVSSSKNAKLVLESAGLLDRFEVIVDGIEAAAADLAGKPEPDTYLDAAEQLGVSAARAVVIEDAISGVQAGRAGDFGLVIGVDRGAGADRLRDNGADLVVTDLAELITIRGTDA